MPTPVLVGVNDLFFSSKITAPANQLGIPMKCFPSCDHILTTAKEVFPGLIILDLESVLGDPIALIRTLKKDKKMGDALILVFGRHTNAEKLTEAKNAGADQVMPRSEFVEVLPEILRSWSQTDKSS